MKSSVKLIADSGSTKADWCILDGNEKQLILTQGISPYFLNKEQIIDLLRSDILPVLGGREPDHLYYYGTGLGSAANLVLLDEALRSVFATTHIEVNHDLSGAARALCGRKPGIACILGTGSNSGFYDGSAIVKNSPGLGFILGDEGSGAYLGKKTVQYYLYRTFEEDLILAFESKYQASSAGILDAVYRKPFPNRYLASFTYFLSEHRGHYMIENIIEDGLNDFFFHHICKYAESWNHPIHFTGSVAWEFRDVVQQLASVYELELGSVLKNPMEGLIRYHLDQPAIVE